MRSTLERYVLENPLAVRTVSNLRETLRLFESWAQAKVSIAELTDDLVNRWLLSLEAKQLSPVTIKNRRVSLLTIWRAGHRMGSTDRLPNRIRRVKVPLHVPEAWPQSVVQSLLAEAATCDRHFRSSPEFTEGQFWRAWLLVLWDTGFRFSDMMRLRREQITAAGTVVMVQHKTGWPHVGHLRTETILAIDALQPTSRECVFDVMSRRQIFKRFAQLCQRAGLQGRSQKMRRSSATAVERQQPGSAMQFLGHKTAGLAYRHYVDPRLLDHSHRPLPPRIA